MTIDYIAGLFDGEGCISIHFNHSGVPNRYKEPRKVLQVTITNTCRPVLELIKERYGFGCVHSLTRKKETHKQCFSWTITGKNSLAFLREIAPLLHIKKEKALEVLDAYNSV